MLAFLLAILSGALMSVQGVFNSEVTKQSSIWVATGLVHLTAFLVCIIAWFVDGRPPIAKLAEVQPRYFLLGGAIGALITFTVVRAISALGPAQATMLIVVTQLAVSWIIELFGLFGTKQVPFSFQKLLAVGVMVAGILWFRYAGEKNPFT